MIVVHILTRLLKAGSEENTLSSCRYQVDIGNRVIVIYGRDFDLAVLNEAKLIGIECIHVPEMINEISPLQDLRAIQKIRSLLTELSPDILHTHQSKAGILGRSAAIGTGCGVVHSVHIVPFEHVSFVKKWIYILAEKFCAKFTNQFINVSNGTRDIYLRHSIGRTSNHRVIHSGMDIEKYTARTPGLAVAENADNSFNVVMLASFESRKRQEPFIRAIAPLLADNPEIRLFFCGEGECLAACKEFVHQTGLSDQITFAGFVDCPEKYVKLADLGILVSKREGLPRVLVQFLAAGVPVLTTWLQGIEEIVHHNLNGLISKSDDIDAVVKDIVDLSRDKVRYNKLRAGARDFSADNWDVKKMGPAIVEVYKNALKLQHR